MSTVDWRWKIGEAVERLRTRYQFIGRTTGAPFLALVYPPEAEVPVLQEWHTQTAALRPDIDVRHIDVLDVTQAVLTTLGAEAVVEALTNPMPGSHPETELGQMWIAGIVEAVRAELGGPGGQRRVISLERLAALYPAAGPRHVMQYLWDGAADGLQGPVVVLIPGVLHGPRNYSFLGQREELMYRGDLL